MRLIDANEVITEIKAEHKRYEDDGEDALYSGVRAGLTKAEMMVVYADKINIKNAINLLLKDIQNDYGIKMSQAYKDVITIAFYNNAKKKGGD